MAFAGFMVAGDTRLAQENTIFRTQTWADYLYKLTFSNSYQSQIRRRSKVLLNCAFCRGIPQTKVPVFYRFCECCLCSEMTESRSPAYFKGGWVGLDDLVSFGHFYTATSNLWSAILDFVNISLKKGEKRTRHRVKLVKILAKAKFHLRKENILEES